MSATSAIVTIGSSGWDPGVQLRATADLHEGDRATWILRIHESGEAFFWDVNPDALVRDLFALAAIHVLGFRDGIPQGLLERHVEAFGAADRAKALEAAAEHYRDAGLTTFATAYDGSTLCGQVEDFGRIRNGDLEVHRAVYRRLGSLWPGSPDQLEGDLTLDPLSA